MRPLHNRFEWKTWQNLYVPVCPILREALFEYWMLTITPPFCEDHLHQSLSKVLDTGPTRVENPGPQMIRIE
jgi:hypothetical protein